MIRQPLLRAMYEKAVDECDKQSAWLFEEEFTKQILSQVESIVARCYQELPIERAAALLWVQEEIDNHFYGDNDGTNKS